ncbi:hypothetical protein SSX86_017134 [Deinandra increscens subsp. villosa]|uniref:Uncharacterized protein n=1 Tax=Deinandra increscens subsp. villosa TaxID=3103831 RepID=A0AAP0D1T0_9ASTR
MMWIGIYIAVASLFCILPMVADLLHGLKNKQLWFPCKYFTLNAASLTVIAVAMKLPVDLSNSMPNDIDQAAKFGSMAFMCAMMANLLPSLATMEGKELLTNLIALDILVITLVVNVCIQIETGHETALKDLESQQGRITVEKLKQHISNHWIMAVTGSPQFRTVCSATTSASGWIKVIFGASYSTSVENSAQLQYKDLSWYVLHLQDDMEFAERALKSISKSVNRLIKSAEKQQPNNLMKLLEEFKGFEGVGKYVMHQVPHLPEEEKLIMSVSEGLTYVKHVEETLNATDEYVIIQKAARTLWLEVEVYHEWLGNKLQNSAYQDNTTKEIVQWFSDTAENMITDLESKNMKGSDDSSLYMSVSACSMYRITQTILVSNHVNIDQVSEEELFAQLSSMISNIFAACLTNLPQVIAMKCHTNVIEKREESVHAAAQLLGETMQIINSLQERQLPRLDCDELPFIDKWHDCFLHISP